MKHLNVILSSLVIIIVGGGLYYLTTNRATLVGEQSTPSPRQNAALAEQTNAEGEITVIVRPLELSSDASPWSFEIALDTHSGSLDQDLMQSAVLLTDTGQELTPLRWEGAEPGGHHRAGTLFFNAPSSRPQSFSMVIKNVGGVSERVFRWDE